MENVIVIGSGPAGYTAAIYLARAELKPVVLAGEKAGGQLMWTTEVENFPGFKEGIMGPELMAKMREQAARFGANIQDKNVTKVDFSKKPFKVWIGEQERQAKAVIIATGAESMKLGVEGEDKFLGKGVSTCAVCDAPFYKDAEKVMVVGGGDSAMEEVMAVAKYAKKVVLVHRRDYLRASVAMQNKVQVLENVEYLLSHEVIEILGKQKTEGVKVKNIKSGEMSEMKIDGIFISIGYKPVSEIFRGQVDLDEKNYIKTKMIYEARVQLWLDEYPTMTSVEGVFACGDVVDFRYRQAVTAAGFGTMAALDVEKFLNK